MRWSVACSFVGGLVLLAVVGCGKPKLLPVQGVVSQEDGTPAGFTRVYFWPAKKTSNPPPTRIGVGFCDEKGKFTVKCGQGEEGLEAGEYRITFSRPKLGGKSVNPEQRFDGTTESVPMPYSDHKNPENSPVTATVDGSEITLTLPRPAKDK